jgi:hypothetical protein
VSGEVEPIEEFGFRWRIEETSRKHQLNFETVREISGFTKVRDMRLFSTLQPF